MMAALAASVAAALIRGGTLWITRGHLPGSRAVGLRVDYQNERWRLVWYGVLRCCVPVLYQMLVQQLLADDRKDNNNNNNGMETATLSVEQMRALRRRRYVMTWIEKWVERILPTLRWAAWTTAFWWTYASAADDDDYDNLLISPELEMRLSGLSYRPIASTTAQAADSSPHDRIPLNWTFGQRRWMWEILVRSAQLYAAGLLDLPQMLVDVGKHSRIAQLARTGWRELLQGECADTAVRYACQKCGRSPTNAVKVTCHGKPIYECYLCAPEQQQR
jgi:hypothetical protein